MPQLDPARLQLADPHLVLLLSLLARHVPEADVWAYGSRVTGGCHEGSDLDLVLRHPQDLGQEVAGWFDLKEALQDSSLPMLVEIHLWPRLPAAFHAEIERGYVVVQVGVRGVDVANAGDEV